MLCLWLFFVEVCSDSGKDLPWWGQTQSPSLSRMICILLSLTVRLQWLWCLCSSHVALRCYLKLTAASFVTEINRMSLGTLHSFLSTYTWQSYFLKMLSFLCRVAVDLKSNSLTIYTLVFPSFLCLCAFFPEDSAELCLLSRDSSLRGSGMWPPPVLVWLTHVLCLLRKTLPLAWFFSCCRLLTCQ